MHTPHVVPPGAGPAITRPPDEPAGTTVAPPTTTWSNPLKFAFRTVKVASPDLVNRPLLARIAQTRRPVIVSTGAARMDEVEMCAEWLREWGDVTTR